MQRTIKVELLEADIWSIIKDRSAPPEGIKIEGPISTALHGVDAPKIAEYLVITVSYVGVFAAGVARDVLAEKAKQWITDFLARHKAKRTRINGREANPDTVAQIIREEIEIGKDD